MSDSANANNVKSKRSVLVVDDNATNLRLIQEILKDTYRVHATLSGERALGFLEYNIPDLILLDVEMPGLNGYEVMDRLKKTDKWKNIPVIFLTAQEGAEKEEMAFKVGAMDYITKPISSGVVLSRMRLHMELEHYKRNLEEIVEDKTLELQHTQDAILDILSNVTAFRDNETGGHNMRTTIFTKLLMDYLFKIQRPGYEVTKEYTQNTIKCAKLHDIGKVAISDSILLKPGKLTDEEFEIMKTHTVKGGEMIDHAINDIGGDSSSFLYTAKEIVLCHHERWDGRGYPNKICGEKIPISARVMAIADVYDALMSTRPYKKPLTHEQAIGIIREDSGHFDPNMVEFCRDILDRFEYIAQTYNDERFPFYSSTLLRSIEESLEE